HAFNAATTPGDDTGSSAVVNRDGTVAFFLDNSTNLINPTPAAGTNYTGKDTNGAIPNDGIDLFASSLPVASGSNPALLTMRDKDLPSLTANGASEVSPIQSVSDDGRFTVFMSNAVNVVPGQVDTNKTEDVFLYDKTTGAVTLISQAFGAATGTTGSNIS